MNDMIQVVIKRPNMEAEITEIENKLSLLQGLVGGQIETLTYDDCVVIVNEDGFWENLPINTKFRGHYLRGTVIGLSADGEGEFVSLEKHEACELAEELDEGAW